jgi:invasion protein IalB
MQITLAVQIALTAVWLQAGQAPAPAPPPPASATAPASATPPGEATSVQENYDNWTVLCARKDGKRLCTVSQQQMDKDTRQRVMAVELTEVGPTKATGSLLLPFGLAVSKDVALEIDGAAIGPPLHFRTCFTPGCLVALNFDGTTIANLKKGAALAVKVTGDNGQPIAFSLPLKGFASAYDRTAALNK